MSQVRASRCAYCGLPAPRTWWGDVPEGPAYCCYGCRFAASVASDEGTSTEASLLFTRLGLAIFCTMNVMAFTMALWSDDVYGADREGTASTPMLQGMFRYLAMCFAFPVLYTLGLPLLENAWDSLRRRVANIDVLLVSGVAAAYLASAVAVVRDDGPVYFEVACMVLVLVTIGRWLEAAGRRRASHSLDALERLLPETVCVVSLDQECTRPLREVVKGDRLRIRAGERIPCDGVLESGTAQVDEQIVTGEGTVRTREPGDRVFAGSLNLDGHLLITVTAPSEDGALARLVRLIRQAQESRGRLQQLADRIAQGFLPAVFALAVAAAVYHGLVHDWTEGILVALSVVLIACPCALGIATPLAMWTAIGEAAQRGVLILGGEVLERLARVDHLCFDKTGTLTTGMPRVERVESLDRPLSWDGAPGQTTGVEQPWLAWAASMAAASAHVHSIAIARHLGERGIRAVSACQVATLPGRGLRADTLAGAAGPVYLGSERWMEELGLRASPDLAQRLHQVRAQANAAVCLGHAGSIRGFFALTEEWRPELAEALEGLKQQGLHVTILSGDPNLRPLPWESRGGLLPEDKVARIAALRAAGRCVAMVGDGINDGPALAVSDVGIAMGCGADVARDAAAICLLDNDLRKVPWAILVARRAVAILRQNLAWAFVFNAMGIALACVGALNPVVAALAMTVSSLLVLFNSMRPGWPAPRAAAIAITPDPAGAAVTLDPETTLPELEARAP